MNKIKTVYRSAREKAFNAKNKVGTAMLTGFVALQTSPVFAAATNDMVSGFTDEVTLSKGQLWGIGAAVLGVCAITFLIGRGKKASN